MAITIYQEPGEFQSMHEELWHVVESDNAETPGFQYVFDIYKDGSLLTRIKNTPYPGGNYGVFDASRIISSYYTSEFLPYDTVTFDSYSGNSSRNLYTSWTDYTMSYGEVCGQVFTSGIVSASYMVYDRYNRRPWDKVQSAVNGTMILSNRPTESYWYDGHPVALSVFYTTGQVFARSEYNTNDNTLLSYFSESNPYDNPVNEMVFWNPAADNVTFELSGTVSGIIGTRKIKKKCSKYDKHTLLFFNAFGGYDSFTFVHGKLMMDNEKKKFEQFRYRINEGVNSAEMSEIRHPFNLAPIQYNEGMKTYASKYKQKMQLTSDILSSGEWDWLAELINSPAVYYFDINTGVSYPVQITDANYELKDDLINKADTLQVNIEFGISNYTQFR